MEMGERSRRGAYLPSSGEDGLLQKRKRISRRERRGEQSSSSFPRKEGSIREVKKLAEGEGRQLNLKMKKKTGKLPLRGHF